MRRRYYYERPRTSPWTIIGWLLLIGLCLIGLLNLAFCAAIVASVPA